MKRYDMTKKVEVEQHNRGKGDNDKNGLKARTSDKWEGRTGRQA